MEELLKQMLGGKMEEWTSKLQGMDGFDTSKAKSFLAAIVSKVTSLFESGELDMTSLMGDVDIKGLVSQLEPEALAEQANVTSEQAETALNDVLPDLVGQAKSALGGFGDMFKSLDS